MDPASIRPAAQVFVCTNLRAPNDALTSGCGAAGPAVYNAVKRVVGSAGHIGDVWVTRTACLGQCPPRGCAVVIYPSNEQLVNVIEPDAREVATRAIAAARGATKGPQ